MPVCALNSEISPESLDFAMVTVAIAAQLCGNATIVGCASDPPNAPAGAENGGLAPDVRSAYTAAFRERGESLGATILKEFPYIGLLDSSCPSQEY